jgi:hypothetical protein
MQFIIVQKIIMRICLWTLSAIYILVRVSSVFECEKIKEYLHQIIFVYARIIQNKRLFSYIFRRFSLEIKNFNAGGCIFFSIRWSDEPEKKGSMDFLYFFVRIECTRLYKTSFSHACMGEKISSHYFSSLLCLLFFYFLYFILLVFVFYFLFSHLCALF